MQRERRSWRKLRCRSSFRVELRVLGCSSVFELIRCEISLGRKAKGMDDEAIMTYVLTITFFCFRAILVRITRILRVLSIGHVCCRCWCRGVVVSDVVSLLVVVGR